MKISLSIIDNAVILGKTTETVTSSDLDAINKALEDYSKLSEAAKKKLTNGEKALLDSQEVKALKSQIDNLEKENTTLKARIAKFEVGDVNEDGKVDICDVTKVVDIILKK